MADGEFVRQVRASSEESHQYLEVNQSARGAYRVTALVCAAVYAAVGVVALVLATDVPFSGESGHGWWGLILNRAGGVLLIALAVLVAVSALLPGNTGAGMLTGAGVVVMLVGLFFLAVYRTSANVVAFTVIDVIALWVVGVAVFWCGMNSFVAGDHRGRTVLGDDHREYRDATATS
jgi:hypothetical protein